MMNFEWRKRESNWPGEGFGARGSGLRGSGFTAPGSGLNKKSGSYQIDYALTGNCIL